MSCVTKVNRQLKRLVESAARHCEPAISSQDPATVSSGCTCAGAPPRARRQVAYSRRQLGSVHRTRSRGLLPGASLALCISPSPDSLSLVLHLAFITRQMLLLRPFLAVSSSKKARGASSKTGSRCANSASCGAVFCPLASSKERIAVRSQKSQSQSHNLTLHTAHRT